MIDLALYPSEISHAAFVFDSFLELFQNPLGLDSNIGLINVKFLHPREKESDITLIDIFRVVGFFFEWHLFNKKNFTINISLFICHI